MSHHLNVYIHGKQYLEGEGKEGVMCCLNACVMWGVGYPEGLGR